MLMPDQQVRHPLFAWFYSRVSTSLDAAGVGQLRAELLAGLSGAVVEVGAGNGLNFGHYPDTVAGVQAVEPEPHLRGRAEQAAASAAVPVKVVEGTAERLPAEDGSADAVVATLMFCSVPDVSAALAEIRRVLRPGGQLVFMEHVRGESRVCQFVQRVADGTIRPALMGGCRTHRDPVAAIKTAGFTVVRLTTYRQPESRLPWPTVPHARGIAVRD
jgi:ubiquinone/menaquinone biosynthesis C-methylase UbiE